MNCCVPADLIADASLRAAGTPVDHDELVFASRDLGNGLIETHLSVPSVHCGGCIATIEKKINALEKVSSARLNLSLKQLHIQWKADDADLWLILNTLSKLGYEAHLSELGDEATKDRTQQSLFIALGVAAFATANIMLLSVSVWSGASDTTRDLFHWISALIAVPTVAFSGQIFFKSALNALKNTRLNMDVPISLAIILALAMSIFETINHGQHAYFDACVTLLFFLLIGRTLDHVMRKRAASSVANLNRLSPRGATLIDGKSRSWIQLSAIKPDMELLVQPGERLAVDGIVAKGSSEVDSAHVTGESLPILAKKGTQLFAGSLNLTAPLHLRATHSVEDSFLGTLRTMIARAEDGHKGFRKLADRAAELYAPAVHLIALASFLGWLFATGDWYRAAYIAVAVLIITCPCALGLAVPIVQVVAAGRLMKEGVLMRDGVALERLATITHVIFDKTGTLTTPTPTLENPAQYDVETLALAAQLASQSRHPFSQALVNALDNAALEQPDDIAFDSVEEIAGSGIEAKSGTTIYRLGRAAWAQKSTTKSDDQSTTILTRNGEILAKFSFNETLRPGAVTTIAALKAKGIGVSILSGDTAPRLAKIARQLQVSGAHAEFKPEDKMAFLTDLQAKGEKVLMVGDGINDAPALIAADASMAPASAADIGRTSADFLLLHNDLTTIMSTLIIAKKSRQLILQNFALALIYNAIAVPIAIAGLVTPLIAALAMSSSSILVCVNAMRLNAKKRPTAPRDDRAPTQMPATDPVQP